MSIGKSSNAAVSIFIENPPVYTVSITPVVVQLADKWITQTLCGS